VTRPLLTFALFAYNQEQFVREAVEGAFAQTYSPLEIILSDDGSSDRTFEIMTSMAAAYRGPHAIVLNRNATNLKPGAHVNKVNALARGELVVGAAGDDVSLPQRTERNFEAWVQSERRACSIFSAAVLVDPGGREVGFRRTPYQAHLNDLRFHVENHSIVLGATHAWQRRLFDVFGPLSPTIVAEDVVIPFRSLLLGEIRYVEEPLVRYRVGGVSDMRLHEPVKDALARLIRWKRISRDCDLQRLADLEKAPNADPAVEAALSRHLRRLEYFIEVVDRGLGPRLLGRAFREGLFSDAAATKEMLRYSFPMLHQLYLRAKRPLAR
jgi:glycosyltransferase involved in cell wall biosynthesis